MPDTKMVKIADYCSVIKGKIGIKKAVEGKYPLVTTAEERLNHNEYHFDRPSVIIPLVSSTGHGHASLKRIHYQEGKFAVGSILCAVTPKDENVLKAQFLYHYLDVYKEKLLVSRMRGMANVTLPVTEIENMEFPLLSADKQKEWVSLFENTASFTGSLKSEITHQQSLLKKLRQSILQDAISGKLTEEWRRENPDVESATELLARIKAEKEQLVNEKKIKKQKPLPPIIEDEIPYKLSRGWEWVRLQDISYNLGQKKPDKKFTYIDVTTINKEKGTIDKVQILDPGEAPSRARKVVNKGTVIYATVRPYLLNIAIVDREFKPEPIVSTAFAILKPYEGIINKYLYHFLRSKIMIDYVESKMVGMAYPAINDTQFFKAVFPLPPFAEQKRIVAKIEKLFTNCDELEQQIDKSQQDSELLMQTVLKEAFDG